MFLNNYGQDVERDNVEVNEELTVRDTTIIDLIEEHTSGATIGAENGLDKDGNNIIIGNNPLNQPTSIPGAGYNFEVGTIPSKVGNFIVNAGGDITINADGDYVTNVNGIGWIFDGTYWISDGGDTLMTNTLTDAKILATLQIIPFNFDYTFDATITDSRPGPGLYRLNNATYSNVTQIFIDNFDTDNVDKSNFLSRPDTGSYITITDGTNYVNYQLTGALTAASSYFKYEVTYLSNSGVVTGLNTISLDLSNSVGSGGGLVDKLANATDTIALVDDTLSMTEQILDAQSVVIGDTLTIGPNEYKIYEKDIPGPVTPLAIDDLNGNSRLEIDDDATKIIGGIDSTFIQVDEEFIMISFIENGFENKTVIVGDTIYSDGTGNSTANNIKAKTLYAGDSLWVGDGWITGVDTSNKLTGLDLVETDTLVIAGDTTTGMIDAQTAIEAIEFEKLQFTPTTQAHSEGTVFYDTNEYALTVYNDVLEFKEELGRGINVRYYNNTGETINDGDLLRSIGAKVNGAVSFTADFAGICSLDSLQGIAMATNVTLDGEFGMATLIGQVNGLNTSAFNDNDLLWAGYNRTYTDTSPEAPDYSFIIGRVVYADADSGAIYMFPTGDVVYSPNPIFTASFEDSTETITNPGIDIYEVITSATNSLFEEKRNIGFTFQGDSISPKQDGNYTIFFSYSFQGTVSQTDLYRIGTFIDGVKGYSTSRTASGTNNGGVPYPYSAFLSAGQWISFRVVNKTDGSRNCVFTDGTVTINFSE